MEVENASPESIGSERQKREDDVPEESRDLIKKVNSKRQKRVEDANEESRYLMDKVKAFRASMLEYLSKWNALEYEKKPDEIVPVNLDDMGTYMRRCYFKMIELFSLVEYKDLQDEVSRFQDIVALCDAERELYMKTYKDKYDNGEWPLICCKIMKIPNVHEKMRNDKTDWKVRSRTILQVFHVITEEGKLGDSGDSGDSGNLGDTDYQYLRNRLDCLLLANGVFVEVSARLDGIQYTTRFILDLMERALMVRKSEMSERKNDDSGSEVASTSCAH